MRFVRVFSDNKVDVYLRGNTFLLSKANPRLRVFTRRASPLDKGIYVRAFGNPDEVLEVSLHKISFEVLRRLDDDLKPLGYEDVKAKDRVEKFFLSIFGEVGEFVSSVIAAAEETIKGYEVEYANKIDGSYLYRYRIATQEARLTSDADPMLISVHVGYFHTEKVGKRVSQGGWYVPILTGYASYQNNTLSDFKVGLFSSVSDFIQDRLKEELGSVMDRIATGQESDQDIEIYENTLLSELSKVLENLLMVVEVHFRGSMSREAAALLSMAGLYEEVKAEMEEAARVYLENDLAFYIPEPYKTLGGSYTPEGIAARLAGAWDAGVVAVPLFDKIYKKGKKEGEGEWVGWIGFMELSRDLGYEILPYIHKAEEFIRREGRRKGADSKQKDERIAQDINDLVAYLQQEGLPSAAVETVLALLILSKSEEYVSDYYHYFYVPVAYAGLPNDRRESVGTVSGSATYTYPSGRSYFLIKDGSYIAQTGTSLDVVPSHLMGFARLSVAHSFEGFEKGVALGTAAKPFVSRARSIVSEAVRYAVINFTSYVGKRGNPVTIEDMMKDAQRVIEKSDMRIVDKYLDAFYHAILEYIYR